MDILNIGFNNQIVTNRLLSIVIPDAAPIKRLIQAAKENGTLVDASYGRKTRSVLIMDNGFIFLSSIQPDTLVARLKEQHD
ncbi:MAG: extracellular matrix/biofilm biosynthesis regulator RemA family protein [Candidatus Avoscillospira sp.]